MNKLRPVPKICQVKYQSLDYMANKVPVDLRGWVAAAENPHWFAWPDGPTTKNEQCSPAARMKFFGSQSKKGRRGVFCKEGCLFGMHGGILVKARDFSCNKGEKLQ